MTCTNQSWSAHPEPGSELALRAASAVLAAESALARAQAAVDQHPTAARVAERDRWATELAERRLRLAPGRADEHTTVEGASGPCC